MKPFDQAWRLLKFDYHYGGKYGGHFKAPQYINDKYDETQQHIYPNTKGYDPSKNYNTMSRILSLNGQSRPRLKDDGSYVGVNLSQQDFTDDSKWDKDVENLTQVGTHETIHHLIEPEIDEWAKEESGMNNEVNRENNKNPFERLSAIQRKEKNYNDLSSIGHEFGAYSLTPDSSHPSGFLSEDSRKEYMSQPLYQGSEYTRGEKQYSDLRSENVNAAQQN